MVCYLRPEVHTVDLSRIAAESQSVVSSSRNSVCLKQNPKRHIEEEGRKTKYRGQGYSQPGKPWARKLLEPKQGHWSAKERSLQVVDGCFSNVLCV